MTNSTRARLTDQQLTDRKLAGLWLKERREAAGLTQRGLAAQTGDYYFTFVSEIESGRGRLPPEKYEIFSNVLGVDSREFAIKMLKFFEPTTYELIFGDEQ